MKRQDNISINPLYIDEQVEAEIMLWRAVIMQNLDDLKLPLTNKKYRSWVKQATKWFSDADVDFYMVCELASINPQFVLQQAHHLMVSRKKL